MGREWELPVDTVHTIKRIGAPWTQSNFSPALKLIIDTETPVLWFPPLSIHCCATSTPIINHFVQSGVTFFSVCSPYPPTICTRPELY